MSYPETKLACVSNLWVRQMHFLKAGDQNEGHVHNFDHITLLSKGRVAVDVDGVISEFSAPQMIYIAKGKSHFVRALEDDTIACCIHALRTGEREEDVLDPSMIPAGVTNPLAAGLVHQL